MVAADDWQQLQVVHEMQAAKLSEHARLLKEFEQLESSENARVWFSVCVVIFVCCVCVFYKGAMYV